MVYQPHIEDAKEILSDDEIIALMPKNFIFIAHLINVENALKLIKAYGGMHIFIPSKTALNVHHDITGVIGLKALKALAEHMGGERIEVPMGTLITSNMRYRLIQQAIARKESKTKIARKFGVTIRTIRSAAKAEIKPNQKSHNLDLFE